jgi:hypothetical protein
MTTPTHTPLPWRIEPLELHEGGVKIAVVGANGETVADQQTYYPAEISDANAALIVRAINAYDELVEALEKAKQRIEQLAHTVNVLSPGKVRAEDFTDVVVAALAKAGR